MNLISKALLPLILTLSFMLRADDHVQQAPNLFPLETLQCNFNENKDIDDLNKLKGEWNKFVQENDDVTYASWIVTPMYRSASDFTNDIAWLGVSPNWTSFGSGYDAWFNKAGKLASKFNDVYTCATQQLFAAQMVRQSKSTSDSGVMMVSNCSLINDATLLDVAAADQKWNKYLDSQGSEGAIIRWYPGPGTPTDLDYSFKYVTTAPSWTSWGESSEAFVNGGGLMKQQEIFGNIVSCDSARFYVINAYGGQSQN